ncbi:tRNA pseudouridine synthase [Basidiobolus meristosporus CBS 931.73]|uniref:tRNA pseudouridine synthase 1 n=1 Tax=Basidiobolus meristosporus CBS 931.73 TaxID=1314790 RepID=A0A1Y1YAL3_9FUNG|nr:tRNA pseudouridine synthase [Basidiobolus meristosporus CBS 931.73]|eukprot:ORX94955.1 tRNA pseudouridine synthase [Basidiobolus meristosporus CBS 931.73]
MSSDSAQPPTVDSQTTAVAENTPDEPVAKKRRGNNLTHKDRREFFQKHRTRKQQDGVRNRERKSRDDDSEEEDEEGDSTKPNALRRPKKKVALLLGFCGTEYQGMQSNPNAKTIEGELFKGLVKAGAISQENADDMKKVGLTRATRTDKGVHAAGQLVSLKLIVEDSDILEKINESLPEDIRVWGYIPVIKTFHAKTLCDSRVYEYLLPTYVLAPPNTSVDLSIPQQQRTVQPTSEEEFLAKKGYRVSADQLERIKGMLSRYVGTHNYHNYTVGKSYEDKSANRYIISFQCGEPTLINDMEWLSFRIHGQSFMIHQIRKMMGMIILTIRTGSSLELVERSFGQVKMNIPKAPGLGLLLEEPVFATYNRKSSEKERPSISFEAYRENIDAFKNTHIYPSIVHTECQEKQFDQWIGAIDTFPESYAEYLNV